MYAHYCTRCVSMENAVTRIVPNLGTDLWNICKYREKLPDPYKVFVNICFVPILLQNCSICNVHFQHVTCFAKLQLFFVFQTCTFNIYDELCFVKSHRAICFCKVLVFRQIFWNCETKFFRYNFSTLFFDIIFRRYFSIYFFDVIFRHNFRRYFST